MTAPNARPPIAVVGVSALFPGSVDRTGFWHDILAGKDLITDVPQTHWLVEDHYDPDPKARDKTYGKRGGFLDDVDFDAMGFGMPPNAAPATDTSQLLALIVAQQVLDDATRGQFREIDRSNTSIILGVTSGQELLGSMASRMQRPLWLQGMRRAGVPEDEALAACDIIADLHPEWQESTFPGLLGNVVAGRIANRLDLGGTNCVTDAACASSVSALAMGVNELYLGDSDMVITGGVDTMNDIFMFMCFSKTPALSMTGDIRPFSAEADGTMLGEGLGMVALKRLEDAERDGDRIYCLIHGIGTSSDGRAKSVYAPVSAGQSRAVADAYGKADYGPETVELVEAHGTGTIAGDAAEFEGLRMSFESSGRDDTQWCALGSVKSQIGHTKAAAGAAGLFKVVMALHNKVLPPTIKIDEPNPKLDLENSPFYLNTETRPWVRDSSHERRGSVSSFGFGGSNFHVAVGEYTGDAEHAPRLRALDHEIVVLTGASGPDVAEQARGHAAKAEERGYLHWLAQSTQRDYRHDARARLAVVASDEADLVTKLEQAAQRIEADPKADSSAPFSTPFSTPNGIHFGTGPSCGDVAFVFPGQGSQYLHMGAGLAVGYDRAIEAWDLAADLDWDDEPLQNIVFPRRAFQEARRDEQRELLTATQWAQPAIGTTSLSMLHLLSDMGLTPQHVGGHSFGEITALHAAGVLSAGDMLRVARKRGELMAEAAQTPGSMTAVARPIDEVRALVERFGDAVVVANHNSPNQVVLSGATSAIESIEHKLADEGIDARRLPVATGFHSPIVAGAAGAFAEFLDDIDFRAETVPVYANETAAPYDTDTGAARTQLGRQLAKPVRFVEMVEAMYAAGARTFVEVGPSSVLTGLVSKILGDREHAAVSLDKKGTPGIKGFFGGLCALVAAGVDVDFAPLWAGYDEFENPHEIEKPKLVLPLKGANYQRSYPPADLSDLVGPNPPRADRPAPVVSAAAAAEASATADKESTTMAEPTSVSESPSAKTVESGRVPVNGTSVPAALPAPTELSPSPPPSSAPAPVAQAPSPAHPRTAGNGVLATYRSVQHQTAEAHAAYMNAMAGTHAAFLDSAQRGFEVLARLAGVNLPAPVSPPPSGHAPALPRATAPAASLAPASLPAAPATPPVTEPPVAATPAPAPTVSPQAPPAAPAPDRRTISAPISGPISAPISTPVSTPTPEPTPAPVATTPAPTPEAQPGTTTTAAPASPSVDMLPLLLETVSEKTGYPTDMLTLEMELESDLGIDSIKRVEILSAMQEQVPDLPDVDTDQMAKLATLQQIVDYMSDLAGTTTPGTTTTAAPASPSVDMLPLLLETVSEKTGYPTDMLTLEMELESDLGIDSIKRVEILSAMQEQVPDLPDVDTDQMAKLATLRQIVDYMSDLAGTTTPGTTTTAAPASPSVDMLPLLLETVSEKTGYPTDMLTLEMELESDLGIDSIKRVEILSAMQEQVPDLPDVDTDQMAKLATLQQIVDYMSDLAGTTTPGTPAGTGPATGPGDTPAPSGTPAEVEPQVELGRYVLESVTTTADGSPMPGLTAARIAVVDDGSGVGSALVDALAEHNVKAELVDAMPEAGFGGAVVLGGLAPFSSIDEAVARNRAAFEAARSAAACFSQIDGVFVLVQDTGGAFGTNGIGNADGGVERAWAAGLTGLARTAALEWPSVAVKAIDVETGGRSPELVAEAIAGEILTGGADLEVGLSADGTRTTLRSVAVDVQTGAQPLGPDDVVVVSGGARGVTAATMIELARDTKASFVLFGRTRIDEEPAVCARIDGDAALKRALLDEASAKGEKPTPAELGKRVDTILANREILATVEAIDAAGGRARYVPVDITDAAALEAALAAVRSDWGPVTGVVHGAGVLADKFIADKTTEQFDLVFDTKVAGLRALLSATEDDDVKVIALFSSVAARSGNNGQCDYAMANEVLNKVAVAESLRRPGCVVRALGWGPWQGGMVSPALEKHFEAMGVTLIPLDDGARMLVDEIASTQEGQVELVLGGGVLPETSAAVAPQGA